MTFRKLLRQCRPRVRGGLMVNSTCPSPTHGHQSSVCGEEFCRMQERARHLRTFLRIAFFVPSRIAHGGGDRPGSRQSETKHSNCSSSSSQGDALQKIRPASARELGFSRCALSSSGFCNQILIKSWTRVAVLYSKCRDLSWQVAAQLRVNRLCSFVF